MRFYTPAESEAWLSERDRQKPDLNPEINRVRIDLPSPNYKTIFVAHWISSNLAYRRPVLLLVTEWGIWPSSESWHLYYKLRQTYGDNRLLHEAPGHLFLEHEAEDLASFLQLSILNGWGGYVLTEANYVNAFFSHDEYIEFFAERSDSLAIVRDALVMNVKT